MKGGREMPGIDEEGKNIPGIDEGGGRDIPEIDEEGPVEMLNDE